MYSFLLEILILIAKKLNEGLIDKHDFAKETEVAVHHSQAHLINETVFLLWLQPQAAHAQHVLQYVWALSRIA